MSKSKLQEEVERSAKHTVKTHFDGKLIQAYTETLTFSDGSEKCYECVAHPGAVAILPIDENGNLILIKQWRRVPQEIMIEIPAGLLEDGESPDQCAQRELQEEIGYKAKHLQKIGGFYNSPGFCDEFIDLYLARNLISSKLPEDDHEAIDPFTISLPDALALIRKGEIRDAKTLISIILYAENNFFNDDIGKR